MPQVEKVLAQIATLDPIEREQVIFAFLTTYSPFCKWFERFSALEHPTIVLTPGVCGGVARIIRTRIPVWVVERMRQLGISEIDILRSYPTLRAADLVQAWSYASNHPDEIEKSIKENEED